MNFKKQDEDLSPAEIRELKSRIADLLPNGRWRLFLQCYHNQRTSCPSFTKNLDLPSIK
jgi:hypothetical protein